MPKFWGKNKVRCFARQLRQGGGEREVKRERERERERERGGERERGVGSDNLEGRAQERTGSKVHIQSKTQACEVTFALAIEVHENTNTAKDARVSRIHLSSAGLK